MKKLLATIALIACTLCSAPAFAEISLSDFHLSVEPLFGMKYGELGEYVFLKDRSYASDKLSELDWEIKPLWYAGAQVTGGWKGIEAGAYATVGIPTQTGSMFDSDWLNVQYSNCEAYQYKTNYTESDNYLQSSINWGVTGGYRFKPLSTVSIKPFAGFDYEYIAFDGKGLSGWYGDSLSDYVASYTDTANREYVSGDSDTTVISYKRESYISWLGADVTVLFPHGISCTLGGQISPFLYTISIDDHYQNRLDGNGTEYADICYGYFSACKLYAQIDYAFSEKLSICLHGSYFFYFQPLRGDDYSTIIGNSTYTKSASVDGGASAYYADACISLKYRFF